MAIIPNLVDIPDKKPVEAGEYDLMIATSIIESGIHMPKVNTILVDGADRFGIAALQKLRGRGCRGHV